MMCGGRRRSEQRRKEDENERTANHVSGPEMQYLIRSPVSSLNPQHQKEERVKGEKEAAAYTLIFTDTMH
jgi:hypothetical protein